MSTFGIPYGAPYKAHQKFRQEQLILNEIPDEEYQRLSNGKLSCKICSRVGRTPVLDTPQMLQVHRQSKKHQEALDEIESLKQKKAQRDWNEKQRKNASEHAQHVDSANNARRIASQYANNAPGSIGVAAPDSSLPDDDNQSGIDSLDAPYYQSANSKKRKEPTPGDDEKGLQHGPNASSGSATAIGSFSGYNHLNYASSQQMQPVYKRTKSGQYVQVDQQPGTEQRNLGTAPVSFSVNPAAYSHHAAYYPQYYGHNYQQMAPQPVYMVSNDGLSSSSSSSRLNSAQMAGFQLESARAKYFALLKERGWRQNSSGQWYRDPNVEFEDDDELPPPAPPGLDIVIEIAPNHPS